MSVSGPPALGRAEVPRSEHGVSPHYLVVSVMSSLGLLMLCDSSSFFCLSYQELGKLHFFLIYFLCFF